MKQWIVKNKVFIIFIIFFLLVLLQHQFMWLYHDDYGYASLSYAYNVNGVIGHNFSFNQLLDFLIGHYKVWGGRVLYFSIECILLKFGFVPFRLVQSIIITGIFYMIYKIVSTISKQQDWKIALMTVVCYGLIEIMVVKSGIFWITASVLYLFPLLPFLCFVYWYTIKHNYKKIFYIGNALLIFLASFSQEQIAVMSLGYIGLITVYELYKTKKINWANFGMILSSLIGFSILMLAPGNQIRMQHPTSIDFYKLGFIDKIKQNLPQIIYSNFGIYTRLFTLLFFICICYIGYQCIKKKYGYQLFNKISFISNTIILGFTIYKETGYFNYIVNLTQNEILKIILMAVIILQLLFIIYTITTYFYCKKSIPVICLFYSAIASQVTMLVAPYFPLRSALCFEIVMFIIFIYIFTDFYYKIKNKKRIFYLMIPICMLALLNFCIIVKGYASNNWENYQNHKIMEEASRRIQNGEDISEIKLYKMSNILYSGEQPYMENCDYIKIWMKEYYNLPQDLNIIYVE